MSAAPDPLARRARVRVGVGAALVLALGALGVGALVTAATPHGATSIVAPGPTASSDVAPSEVLVYVHILGEVRAPGLYELREGDRAIDALAAAGGYTDAADRAALNLARLLVDGEQIVVPVVGAAPTAASGASDGRVNLNTATAEELETLPRVGPATAARIIAWREANGRFSSVEDLLAVSGIGEKTLAGFADLVTV